MKSWNKKRKPKHSSKPRWYLNKYLFSVNMNKRIIERCGVHLFIKHCEVNLIVDNKEEHCSLSLLYKRFKHWRG